MTTADTSNTNRKQRLRDAYSPDLFADAGRRFVDTMTRYYDDCQTRQTPALPYRPAEALLDEARDLLQSTPLTNTPPGRFDTIARAFLGAANHLHAPSYMGHQVAPVVPMAALVESLGSHANQGMAVYEMGPFSTVAERALVERLGAKIGWPAGTFDGVVTHGGAIGNTTALLTARNVRYPGAWEQGVDAAARAAGRGTPAIITSGDSHYSIARSAGMLGVGTAHVLKAALDDRRRVDPARLERQLDDAARQGLDVFAMVASACTTPTGAFDPIDQMADIAARRGIWLHVDGAHGGSALMSRTHRDLLKGVERANSLVWDAHKMMFTPALCTFVFYRDKAHSYQAFRQDAPYLFDPGAPTRVATWDSAIRTVECTKRSMGMGLFGLMATFGDSLFEDLIDETFALTRRLYDLVVDAPDFEPVNDPRANIFCFRHIPVSARSLPASDIGALQATIRRRLVESGEYYITQTTLDGVPALRVTMMNPLCEERDLTGLLDAIRRVGAREST